MSTLITAWDDIDQTPEHIEALRDHEGAAYEAQFYTDELMDRWHNPPHPEQTAWECLIAGGVHVTVTEAPTVFAELRDVIEAQS